MPIALTQSEQGGLIVLEWFSCPDKEIIPVKDCLQHCRMEERCLTLPTLKLISSEREWDGKPSTTMLLNGTIYSFLKLTQPYCIDPDSRAFMLAGTKHHNALEEVAKELGLPSEIALNIDRDIFDLLEQDEDGGLVITDYKNFGSFKVAKALGIVETGKQPDPSGAVYLRSGAWGKAGSPKMVSVFQQMPREADNWEAEYQLNRYRIMLEEKGVQIKRMQVQVTVRDGGLSVAHSRGITRNTYRIPIPKLDDKQVEDYFAAKEKALLTALEQGSWAEPCNEIESWEGARCRGYCEVWRYCPRGVLAHPGGG